MKELYGSLNDDDLIGRVAHRDPERSLLAFVRIAEQRDERRCTECGRAWPSRFEACPHDGASLRPAVRDQAAELFADDVITETRKSDSFSGNDYTTVDAGRHETARDVGGPTALSPPFTGTPTPLAAVGPISSGEITAQNARAESAFLPAVEPTSNPDPTKPTKLDPGFVHLVPGTLVDAYEIEKLLGAGGMGAVYGAHHEKLRRRVAVKVISPALSRDRDAIERFEQEAHALARLSHPNVVAVLSVGTLPGDGRAYYVMEWLEGAPLRDSLDHGRLPIEDSIDVLDQIARGLEAAHGSGIVHRDLKPDNIWLQRVGDEPQPLVKILDFGLAKLREHRRTEETAVGIMFGTPQYMSPEQCQSARDVGPATDIYALGCIAYEMLCGRLPFLQDNAAELIVAHQMETPPRPRDLNPDVAGVLDELVYAMLSKEPAQRPTLPAVRSAMMRARQRSSAQSQQSTSPRVAAVQVRSLRARRLQRALFGVGCVVLIALIAFAVTLAARGSADGRDARAHVEPVDAAINVVGPIDSAVAPVVVHEAVQAVPIDAGVPPRRTTAPTGPATVPADLTGVQVTTADAAVADSNVDTASTTRGAIDAAQPEVQSPTAVVPDNKIPEPVTRPAPQTSKPKQVDRNTTYNPFTRRPSTR